MRIDAPQVTVRRVETGVRPVRLRLPFRFGSVTLEACPQLFVRVETEVDGRVCTGHAAEMMVPRWFDKRPAFTAADNVRQLAGAVERAAAAYVGDTPASSFELFARHYPGLMQAGAEAGATSLTTAFGQATLDRAVVDAAAHAHGLSFFAFAQRNGFGMADHPSVGDLRGFAWEAWLAALAPSRHIEARHTIGLLDDLKGAGDAADGLPASLPAAIARYGHTCFKIKLGGDPAADMARLAEVLAVLDARAPGHRYSLDGNEQYASVDALRELADRLRALPALRARPEALLYIEQPIGRDLSFSNTLPAAPAPWLMDEADGSLYGFMRAAPLGWHGVSSKTCKGLYKAIVNRARCDVWNEAARRDDEPARFFMSGEDLTCQAGLSVQQDLALVALLGLTHGERNGHYYGGGFGTAPAAEQAAFVAAHGDLYDTDDGPARLTIRGGRIDIGSLHGAGYAHGADPDWQAMQPLAAAASML